MNTTLKKTLAGVAGLGALALGGAAIAGATGPEQEGGAPVSAAERSSIERAALKATGGGRVNAVERDGENGATYEAEVRKPDGSTVDVRLDEDYGLVVVESDSEDPDSDDGS